MSTNSSLGTLIERLKRYDLVVNYRAGSSIEEMQPADDGEWCRVKQVQELLQSLSALSPAPPQAETPELTDSQGRRYFELPAGVGRYETKPERIYLDPSVAAPPQQDKLSEAVSLLKRWTFPDGNVPWEETKQFLSEGRKEVEELLRQTEAWKLTPDELKDLDAALPPVPPAQEPRLRDYAQHKRECAVNHRKDVEREEVDDYGYAVTRVRSVANPQPCDCGLAQLLVASPPAQHWYNCECQVSTEKR